MKLEGTIRLVLVTSASLTAGMLKFVGVVVVVIVGYSAGYGDIKKRHSFLLFSLLRSLLQGMVRFLGVVVVVVISGECSKFC